MQKKVYHMMDYKPNLYLYIQLSVKTECICS